MNLHLLSGKCLKNLGRYLEALYCYDKAFDIDPKHALTINGKGSCLLLMGRQN
jgi:tetratricopeptide (TPR) repeat protein